MQITSYYDSEIVICNLRVFGYRYDAVFNCKHLHILKEKPFSKYSILFSHTIFCVKWASKHSIYPEQGRGK